MPRRIRTFTKDEIIHIASKAGFFYTVNSHCGWARKQRLICNELVKEGVLKQQGRGGRELFYHYVKQVNRAKLLAQNARKTAYRRRFMTRSGILSMLDAQGSVNVPIKPKNAREASFNQHCKNMHSEGILVIKNVSETLTIYVKGERE